MKKSKNRTPDVESSETIKQLTEEKEFWHREAIKNANECGVLKMKLTSFIYGELYILGFSHENKAERTKKQNYFT